MNAIQSLLTAMRQKEPLSLEFKDIVQGITSIVYAVIQTSNKTFESREAESVAKAGHGILDQLYESNGNLERLGAQMIEMPDSKTTKQRLASSSYEIAKDVKALINLLG